jgi:TolB protein
LTRARDSDECLAYHLGKAEVAELADAADGVVSRVERRQRHMAVSRFVWWVALAGVAAVASWAAGARGAAPLQGEIAFVRYTGAGGHPQLFSVAAGGGVPRRLTIPLAAVEGPVWSPRGGLLAVVGGSNPSGSSQLAGTDYLYVWRPGSARVRPLTPRGFRVSGPAWSPDGKRIAFTRSARSSNHSSLWTVAAGGGPARRVAAGGITIQPSWSRDRRSIAFVRIDPANYQSGVWLVRPDGRGLKRILAGVRNATEPVWSPDGARLLVEDGRALFTVRPDGTELKQIVRLSADAQGAVEDPQAAWSPDGKWIVFCQARAAAVGRSDLWVVKGDGSGLRRLTHSPEIDRDPTWGP